MAVQQVDARLVLRAHEPRNALLEIEYRSPRTRLLRALGTFLGFCLLAPLVSIVPPHIPWALGAVLTGIYLAVKQWTGEYIVGRFEGSCPRCNADLPLPPRLEDSSPSPDGLLRMSS